MRTSVSLYHRQTAKDLVIDLKRLKQRLEVEAEIERTATPEPGEAIAQLTTSRGLENGCNHKRVELKKMGLRW